MPPILSEEESLLNPYALLEISATANEKDIQRAYRKKSLKFHPDRNPGPEAAIKFREISLSLEILLDVGKRSYVDNKLEGDRRKKEKNAKLDLKRKEMVDALNAREEDAKKAKVERAKASQQHAEEEAIKEAGRKLREAAQLKAAALAETQNKSNGNTHHTEPSASHTNNDRQPPITPLDLTISLQFPATSQIAQSSSQALQTVLQTRYGPISHVILRDPPSVDLTEGPKKKKSKGKKAVVEFEKRNWGGCWACWKDHQGDGKITTNGIEEGVKSRWVANGGAQPEWVDWASKQSQLPLRDGGGEDVNHRERETLHTNTPSFGSAPDLGGGTTMAELLSQHRSRTMAKAKNEEFESMTLLKMRQMERERLAEQIRREEEEEEG